MSSLPTLSASKSDEIIEKIPMNEASTSSLPKLDTKQVNKPVNKNTKGSPRTTKTRLVHKESPRQSPRTIKPVKDEGSQNSHTKLVSIQKHRHHHHQRAESDVPMLSRRKSTTQSAEDFAEEAWKAREKFTAFVPRKVLPQMPQLREAQERCTSMQGVVSFLDVAGFTKLTERLALQTDGAERLAEIINKLMGQLLGTLKTGDVIKFSGDAILVFYEPDRTLMSDATVGCDSETKTGEDYSDEPAMMDAAYRAVSEGLRALHDDYIVTPEELGTFADPDDIVSKEGIKLSLHVAICAGDLQLMHVGGCFGRWEVLMAGSTMSALGPTADNAPTDHLVIESKAWKLLEANPKGNQFEGIEVAPGFFRILAERTSHTSTASVSPSLIDPQSLCEKYVTREDMEVLLRYVTPVIQRALCTGTLDAVSGFTDVSVLFLGISGVDLAAPCKEAGGMIWGQVIMASVQACVFDHEGAVNKFVMDDKGALLLCGWGLPPMAHADDAHRALMAALHINAEFIGFGIQAHIGVTTGKVFAGVIGPPHRCEYSLLGDTVNLAARLMGKAPFGEVLCDQPTYTSASSTGMNFEVLEPIKVKGKENLQPVFKPLMSESETEAGDAISPLHSRHKPKNARASMWDGGHVDNFNSGAKLLSEGKMRTKERSQLKSILDRFYNGAGGTVVLTGDAGTGKSELAKMVLKSTEIYNSLLIESLTPKKKGLLSEVVSKPCIELSQILQGLLSFNTHAAASVYSERTHSGTSISSERFDSFSFDTNSDNYADESSLPKTVAGWKRRLKACISKDQRDKLKDDLDCFDAYFEEWVDETGGEVSEVRFLGHSESVEDEKYHGTDVTKQASPAVSPSPLAHTPTMPLKVLDDGDSPASVLKKINKYGSMKTQSINMGHSTPQRRGSQGKSITSFGEDGMEEINEDPSAEARRRVLSALLDHVLHSASARPLMIFVHGERNMEEIIYLKKFREIMERKKRAVDQCSP